MGCVGDEHGALPWLFQRHRQCPCDGLGIDPLRCIARHPRGSRPRPYAAVPFTRRRSSRALTARRDALNRAWRRASASASPLIVASILLLMYWAISLSKYLTAQGDITIFRSAPALV